MKLRELLEEIEDCVSQGREAYLKEKYRIKYLTIEDIEKRRDKESRDLVKLYSTRSYKD